VNNAWAALLAIGLALALVAGACNDDGDDGGDGAASLEEYFAAVQGADAEFSSATDELSAEFEALADDQVSEAADLLDEQAALLSGFADDLDAIEPPDEVSEVHNAAISSLRVYSDVFGAAIDDFREAPTISEAFNTFAEVDQSSLEAAQGDCVELEQIAATNDIELDLSCGDGEAA
jgi:hypothetical protein